MLKLDLQKWRLQGLQSLRSIRGCFTTLHRAMPLNVRRVANLCLLLIALFTFRPVNCQGKRYGGDHAPFSL